jgi:hypothetical protein
MTVDLNWRRLTAAERGDDCPYAEVTADAWATVAAATWSGTVDPGDPANTLVLTGPCPRCQHQVAPPVILAVDLAPAVKNLGLVDLSEGETTVRCDCGQSHSARPDSKTGCGAFWRMRFQWSRITASPAPVNLAAGRPATAADLEQLAELDALDESELDRVRSAADKWKTGLTAMLALIATVSVVKGRDSFTTLSVQTQHRIVVIIGAALLAATVAALLAMRAAYGPMRRELIKPNEQLRNLRLRAAADARKDIRAARRLTVLSVVLLALAIGVTWWAKDITPAMVTITKSDDSTVCGRYAKTTGKAVLIKTGDNQTGVPLSRIKSISFTPKC